jgi:Protein of unknown function (DUF1648)
MNLTIDQRYYFGAAAVILLVLIATLVAYPQLQNTVPIHWNAHGQPNGWGPKWSLFLWGPGIMAAIVLLFAALPWLSPRNFEVDSFRSTYLYIMIVLVSMLAYIHVLALAAVWESQLMLSAPSLAASACSLPYWEMCSARYGGISISGFAHHGRLPTSVCGTRRIVRRRKLASSAASSDWWQ